MRQHHPPLLQSRLVDSQGYDALGHVVHMETPLATQHQRQKIITLQQGHFRQGKHHFTPPMCVARKHQDLLVTQSTGQCDPADVGDAKRKRRCRQCGITHKTHAHKHRSLASSDRQFTPLLPIVRPCINRDNPSRRLMLIGHENRRD